jgi:uncharacterized protein with ParB-like and HNH nuclease domain
MTDEEIFKPDNKSIKQIFGDADAFYQMPIYQRPYAWDKERVEQLWYDILEAYKNHKEDLSIDKNYFLGSIVVVKNSSAYDVVDGQQRLTTLTILFCVLRDMELNIEKKNIITNSIKDLVEGKERLKLTTHLNNQATFEESILKKIDFNKSKKDLSQNRFLQTAYYFKNLIENALNEESDDYIEDLDGFINYLFNKTTMIKVVCFDEGFAIKLFTVLNDRGLDLSPADIIKAYLLQNQDEDKRNSFIEVWKQLENIIGFSDESLQGIFNLYLYYEKTENPRKSLQDELKQQFKDRDPQQIILEIKRFAENYNEIISNYHDKHISMLKYLNHSIYWKSILTTAKQVEYFSFDKLKSLLVKYFYQSWIAGGTTNRIKQTSFNILRKVKNGNSIDEIKDLIVENLSKYDSYLGFLKNEYIYWTKWLKPLLLSIEYFEHDQKDFIPITRDLQIEHILPQEWYREDLNWKDYFNEETANQLINSLGNLTLLSGLKNIQASNRNFIDKHEIYKGNSGKGFDGKTGFEITKRIIDDFDIWNDDSIKKRHGWLVKKIEKILNIE